MRMYIDMAKWSSQVGSGQSSYRSNRSHFKRVKMDSGQLGYGSGQVDSYFHVKFFFYKEKIMYLLFGKSYNKLLDVECITLNSPLISKMNSVKLINTYSIILKLYKS